MYDPEEEVRAHSFGSDTSAWGDFVGYAIVRGPDCSEHDSDTLGAIGTLDSEPKHGKDASRRDTKVPKIVAETRSNNNGERDVCRSVIFDVNGSVLEHGNIRNFAPMAPLRTIGTATQEVPTTMMGIASLQFRPTAMILEAVSHVPKLMVSVAQYAIHVHSDHVWFSMGVGSMSALVQTSGGATADSCFGSSHAWMLVRRRLIVSLLGTYFILDRVVRLPQNKI